MSEHHLRPSRETLHGHFSRDLPPVLNIRSGDTVVFELLDAGWHVGPPTSGGDWGPVFERRNPELDAGHALCGPVWIEGARAGEVLQVDVEDVKPAGWGWSAGGGRDTPLNRRLGIADGQGYATFWRLDAQRMTGIDAQGRCIQLRPFLGVMGMPPNAPGRYPTAPPRLWGGNLDCKELVAGSSLYLPIPVDGCLFSAGDGHGVQGDGEVSGVAIECPVESVRLRLTNRADLHFKRPRARIHDAWLTFGVGEDLDEAMVMAVDEMLDLIVEQQAVDRREAIALATLMVDLRITQVVNGVRGVHALLKDEAIGSPSEP